MARRRRNGRHRPRLPVNIVYRTIQVSGGAPRVEAALGISPATLKRWRRAGRVNDPIAVLEWAALVHQEPAAQLLLARRLAGCRAAAPRRRPSSE